MKKNVKIVTCSVLSMMLSQMSVYASETENEDTTKKDETVYAMLNADGSVYDEIISSWLHNASGIKNIEETLDIQDVENVKSAEEPTVEGDTYTWNIDGTDVYYQGTSEKQLPVEVTITYRLDGKQMRPEELAGKSGALEIHIEMKNLAGTTKKIQGKETNIHPLYLAAGILDFSSDHFTNVVCENAKVLSDGNHQMVGFMTIPGFEDTLKSAGIDKAEDLPIKDSYTIKADVKDFEMGPVMIAMTPEVPLDKLKDINTFDELTEGIDALEEATTQLFDGTTQLQEATQLFATKMGELNTSVQPLSTGITSLNLGARQLAEGSSALRSNLNDLDTGLAKVKEGSEALARATQQFPAFVQGAKDLTTGATQLHVGIQQMAEGIDTLHTQAVSSGQLEQLKAALSSLSSVKPLLQNLNTMVTQLHALNVSMNQGNIDPSTGNANPNYSLSNLASSTNSHLATVNSGLASFCTTLTNESEKTQCEGIAQQYANVNMEAGAMDLIINGTTDQPGIAVQVNAMDATLGTMLSQEQMDALVVMIDQLDSAIQGIDALETGITQLASHMPALQTGATDLANGISTLSTSASELLKLQGGIQEISGALTQLQDGSGKLYAGSQSLEAGLQEVSGGTAELANQTPALLSGISQLETASTTLADKTSELNAGMQKFKTTGIDALSEKVSLTMEEIDQILAIKDEILSENETAHTFSGAPEGAESEVKFIYKTKEIKNEKAAAISADANKEEETKDAGLWQKIINFFTNLL